LRECVFCNISEDRIIDETEFLFVIRDLFAVTEHHTLIIPKRHVSSYFDLTPEELGEVPSVLKNQKYLIEGIDPSITGFNIGINIGKDAGQTVFHCHIHLIPRRKGDVLNPRGGIRNIIPGKGDYLNRPRFTRQSESCKLVVSQTPRVRASRCYHAFF
jgi:ATP adenylyltransferase